MTELIDDHHSQINSKQYESLEISIPNMRKRVNLIDNKSRAKNILINNIEEKSTKYVIQLITKVNQKCTTWVTPYTSRMHTELGKQITSLNRDQ